MSFRGEPITRLPITARAALVLPLALGVVAASGCADLDAAADPELPEPAPSAAEEAADEPLAQAVPAPKAFRNPLNLMATTWSSELVMKKSPTIDSLETAKPVVVWRGDNPSRCCNFWAPEFYLLDGPNGKHWYLYFTAGPRGTDTSSQRNFVLESQGTDPMGPYTMKARIFDPRADVWAIDGSILKLNNQLYFDGTPDFGVPVSTSMAILVPSGE